MSFKEIKLSELNENLVNSIFREWMLIAAGNNDGYNMMTASWGFTGAMWGHEEVIAAVRPDRYTMKFIDENDYFTLSFYGDNKKIHEVCGKLSGRNVNKTELTGLSPAFSDGSVYFNEARLVLICKKQYVAPLLPEAFCDTEPLQKWYNGDLHNMIFGKIEKVLIKE